MWKARLFSVMRHYALLIIPTFLFVFILGIAAHALYAEWQKPNCAQEDMCSVDYRNGEWHIEEKAPGTY